MRQLLHALFFSFLLTTQMRAQSGCPGCILQLPAGLPDDTLFLPLFPNGEKGTPYNEDISFRVPKTTTPVHAVDTTTPPGLPITKIEVVGIENMPPGLFWEASQTVFETATETDGCIKICGTPTKSDTFVMTVKLKATILIFTQEASFPIRLYIAPKVSITDGFTMTNYVGCGSTTVAFSNNVPSNGNTGFNYEWSFGDSTTFTGETPPPHTYAHPGVYEVGYKATVDTAGYRLLSATVLSVDGCNDQLGLGAPDLYMFILDPGGAELFNSSPEINNTTLPHTFPVNLKLANPAGSYRLEVWDEDSGLEGSDDPCGTIYFTPQNNGDTLVSGSFKVVLNIDHPVEEVVSTDTVIVYAQPTAPVLTANKLEACEGTNTIVLQSSYGAGNQWWFNGLPISGATDFLYQPATSGYYQVQINTFYGCSAISDSTYVEFLPLPNVPVYVNDRNNLELKDTLLPANYTLQWYLFATPIPGATGFSYCALTSGEYTLVVTNPVTGCTNLYTASITLDPNFDCTLGTGQAIAGGAFRIFPNPASDAVTVRFAEPLPADGDLRIWDVAGRVVLRAPVGAGDEQSLLDVHGLDAGWYAVELLLGGQRVLGRLAIVR